MSHPWPTDVDNTLRAVANEIQKAHRILFVTGAGISADSGLPTYRGFGGLYNGSPTEDGIPIEQALSGQMMAQNPALTWKYLSQIEAVCHDAKPNAAHHMISALAQTDREIWVLTQNIDGLHRAANNPNVIEIHGDLHTLECPRCAFESPIAQYDVTPPTCPECQQTMRPKVVLFGEALPQAALKQLQKQLDIGFDLVFSVGTTSVFPYIAAPVLLAAQAGQPTVEINPDSSEISSIVRYRIPLGAAQASCSLWQYAFGESAPFA